MTEHPTSADSTATVGTSGVKPDVAGRPSTVASGRSRRIRRLGAAGVIALLAAGGLTACGTSSGSSTTVNFYDNPDSDTAQQAVVDKCNKQAAGKYRIVYHKLPKSADEQRQQLVRRLAARDSSIDLLGLDVTWAAEFAEAGWLKQWTGEREQQARANKLDGPLKTATYEGKLYGVPFNSNTQLLWYRKDLVPNPPQTWDEMITMATKLKAAGKPHYIEVQGAQYEGATVWFNSLISSAGGGILNSSNTKPGLGQPAIDALSVMKKVATSAGADPSLTSQMENENRLQMEAGQAAFEINYPFVYPAMQADNPKLAKVFAWAPYPRVDANQKAKVTIGGINLGVSTYSTKADISQLAALCMSDKDSQQILATQGGLPPVGTELYQNPPAAFTKQYPFAADIRNQLDDAAVRPLTPAYQSLSIVVSHTVSPAKGINVTADEKTMRSQLQDALESKGLIP